MIKTYKFKGDESKFFFTSDLHHGHAKKFLFCDDRGFDSVEEHDEAQIRTWNETCDSSSIVFNCGDCCFNDGDGKRFIELNRRLRYFEHHVLAGNHLSGHRQCYMDEIKNQFPNSVIDGHLQFEVYPLVKILDGYKKIIFWPSYVDIQINSTPIVLCHYPIISHNNQARDSFLICGHSHSHLAVTNKNTGKGKRLDVDWGAFRRPINLLEVKSILGQRDIDCGDHHCDPRALIP